MKIFWSWQSDLPGKTGRHVVKAALADAIKALKQAEDIEEPVERDAKDALHLDHDRQGVPGSPDLAPTIFRKIDAAAVFVADVTLVAEIEVAGTGGKPGRTKHLTNSNVAIEYGYALRGIGDERILMVQNTFYGDREQLPFDLKHKSGPIEYTLDPAATAAEIAAERKTLAAAFVERLRPYLAMGETTEPPQQLGMPSTKNAAFFWQQDEVLATQESGMARLFKRAGEEEKTEYRFDEPRAFYLRLIPSNRKPATIPRAKLVDIVDKRRLSVLSRTHGGGFGSRNKYGASAYEPHGSSTTPQALTQLFPTGELWGVSSVCFAHFEGEIVVAMVSLEQVLISTLANFIQVVSTELEIDPPYVIEIGGVGLEGVRLSIPQDRQEWSKQVSEPIYDEAFSLRRVVNDVSPSARQAFIQEFIRGLYELAAFEL